MTSIVLQLSNSGLTVISGEALEANLSICHMAQVMFI